MRTLIKQADIAFTAGTRAITITGDSFTASDIRLIVNETQKKVITSSMQKDNIISVDGGVITYSGVLPALASGDVLTVEIDYGMPEVATLVSEMEAGKQLVVSALNSRGGSVTVNDTYSDIADEISGIIGATVNVTEVQQVPPYPPEWHDLYAVMASVYDIDNPYMYALLLNKYTPSDIMAQFVDGNVVVAGGDSDAGKVTKWVVFKRSSQLFTASYTTTFKNYILGIAVYNADIKNVIFNGTILSFIKYNPDYTVPVLEYKANQFYGVKALGLVTPNVSELKFEESAAFQASTLGYVVLNSTNTSLNIGGNDTWRSCTSLTTFTFPNSLTSLTISGSNTWYLCSSLTTVTFPNSLTSLTISGSYTWNGCASLTTITFPNSLTSLTISGGITWGNCISLVTIILPAGWKLSVNISSATAQSHDGMVAQFANLIDKRADGVNATTVSTSTASTIVTGVNSQFTKVFVIGDTISVNGTAARTIATIDSDTQLTLTANAASTGTGLAYNINKILTLGATNLARVSAAEIQVATDKGWTIA